MILLYPHTIYLPIRNSQTSSVKANVAAPSNTEGKLRAPCPSVLSSPRKKSFDANQDEKQWQHVLASRAKP